MDAGGTTIKTGIYCRGCGYDLRESNLRCPECGRLFNQANPLTFDRIPRSLRVRRWIRRILLLLLLIFLPPGIGLGWLWRGWKAEQEHIASLGQAGLAVIASQPIHPWLPRVLPERWMFLADRAAAVGDRIFPLVPASQPLPEEVLQHIGGLTRLRVLAIRGMRATDQDVHQLRGLSRLEAIFLAGPGVTDQAMADLAEMKRLEKIELYRTSIVGPGLCHLIALPRLKTLWLSGKSAGDESLTPIGEMKQLHALSLPHTRITDAGMKRLAGMTQLRWLSIQETKVGDQGLKCLAGMTALETLILDGTAVTDAGLEHLKGLPKLEHMGLDGVRISLAAEQRLRTALPQLSIVGEPQRPDSPAPATAPAKAGRD